MADLPVSTRQSTDNSLLSKGGATGNIAWSETPGIAVQESFFGGGYAPQTAPCMSLLPYCQFFKFLQITSLSRDSPARRQAAFPGAVSRD